MVDNVAITPGTGATVAADDIGGILHQRVKISLGADGAAVDAVGGAGAVSTAVQRNTLASDDPAVVALQIIDDWDETDRAKANIIVGQAGVAGGAGAVGATTQRTVSGGKQYETVAASATAQVLGATGATGDYLSHVNVQPTSTTVGVVTILDNAAEVHAYPGGTVGADLKPFTIPIDLTSVSGAWKITTGAGVKCTGIGIFT